jgi:hypothetical protein
VTTVVTREYSARRSAGMLQVLIFLSLQAIYSPSGVMLGHGELADRFGVSRRSLVSRLGEWRNGHRLIDRKKRGRKGSDVTWWAASNDLVAAVATELRGRSTRHSRAKVKRGNNSQPQRANFPHVAAPSGRPERAAPKDDHSPTEQPIASGARAAMMAQIRAHLSHRVAVP